MLSPSQKRRRRSWSWPGLFVALAILALPASASAGTVPSGFQEIVAFDGLNEPTAISFSPDGRVFIAEKAGKVRVFDDLEDTTPTTFVDLTEEVYNFWDRGLLGMALDPQFPTDPYVYALYTRDALPGGESPEWGGASPGDPCPTPPGATTDGCVVSGRLVRLTADGNVATTETPLVTDWCQQFPSHSVGDLAFGPEGALFASGGDGASFNHPDWGQDGDPVNPCGDPPGDEMTPPTAAGGALRSQDLRTQADPNGLSGSIIRINPDTGAGSPGNPLAASSDANARRVVGFGLRNPFRITVRPGTSELWTGDVGWVTWEEINRLPAPPYASAQNFGWPCYEGADDGTSARQGSYDSAELDLCEDLYDEGPTAVRSPHWAYHHSEKITPSEDCVGDGGSAISGLAFYTTGPFPDAYDGALFFSDYNRRCAWAMLPGEDGIPDPANLELFDGAMNGGAVDVEVGPDGTLYLVGLNGKVYRIIYSPANKWPSVDAKATPQSGAGPLPVQLKAEASDPDGDELSFAWDLDEDGQFDDSTEAEFTHEYTVPGKYFAVVRVSDPDGAADTDSVEIQVENTPPTAQIIAPAAGFEWAAGEGVPLEAEGTDPQEALPDSAYSWRTVMNHCPSGCHEHTMETIDGVKAGAFVAPEHEYPSSITVELTVTDSGGLEDSESITIDPRTVQITMRTEPAGLELTLNAESGPTPFDLTVIEGTENTAIAPYLQETEDGPLLFLAWSDGGARAHAFEAGGDLTLTATYGLPQVTLGDVRFVPLDLRPPQTSILTGPRRKLRGKRAGFSFASDEPGSSFRCKLDEARWRSCTSPAVLRGLRPGPHRFAVRAVDQAGNEDPTPAIRRFRSLAPHRKAASRRSGVPR